MLAASHRMRRRAEFDAALRGRRAGTRTVVVNVGRVDAALPTQTSSVAAGPAVAPSPLVGFVVSKAVGGAVTRNLVRRRLQHAVAPYVSSLPAESRVVVRALPASAQAPYAVLARDLDSALGRAARAVTPSAGVVSR